MSTLPTGTIFTVSPSAVLDPTKYLQLPSTNHIFPRANYPTIAPLFPNAALNYQVGTTPLPNILTLANNSLRPAVSGSTGTTGFTGTLSTGTTGTTFVACGYAGSYVSTNGLTWNKIPNLTQAYNQITWSGTQFVALGYNNKQAISTNGTGWVESSNNFGQSDNRGLIYNGTYYVTCGFNSSTAFYSSNGTSWTSTTLPSKDYWSHLQWNGSVFLLSNLQGTNGCVSSDGITWTGTNLPNINTSNIGVYGNTFILTGKLGIAISTDGVNFTIVSTYSSPINGSYYFHVSPNHVVASSSLISYTSNLTGTWTSTTPNNYITNQFEIGIPAVATSTSNNAYIFNAHTPSKAVHTTVALNIDPTSFDPLSNQPIKYIAL